MMKQLYSKIPALVFALIMGLMATSTAFGTATIVIRNADAANVGFNDPTPVSPVGGNSGTTLGQQRLNAFQFAASIWGATLTSGPTITISASWSSTLACAATSGTLGSAGAADTRTNFPGATFPNTVYSVALANALSNSDLNGSTAEINARFNSELGKTGCLETLHWYYGLDTNADVNSINLVTVLLHEFAHGFGFQTFTNRTTGAQLGGFPSIYDRFLFDNSTSKTWPQMTDAERLASITNTNNLVWNGQQVVSDAPAVLGTPRLRINSPPSISGTYQIGTADFGARLTISGLTAGVVQALDPSDGAGTATTDACSPLTNAGDVSGKIALIDRGSCTFVVKVKNAQNAGAIGVIIANNIAGLIGMTGSDPTITIPAVSITLADGNVIKPQLASGVNATMFVDGSAPGGADSSGRPRMYAPSPSESGSSISHWDSSLFPNQLMEPNISSDLTHSVVPPQDLTLSLLRDIGWCFGCPQPPPPPTPTPTPSAAANNNFANAQIIRGCTGSVGGHNFAATKESGEPSHSPDSDPGGGSVWYQWQAPISASVTITTAGSTNADTVLAVYTGNSVNSLTVVLKPDGTPAKDDDVQSGVIRTSTLTFNVTAGIVYKIAVDGWQDERGNIVLNWTQSGCTDSFQSTTLTSNQVEIKTWTTGGRTSAYVKLAFPDASYRVGANNWGQPVRAVNDFSADALVERFTGESVQAVKTTAQIYDLGPLTPGNYTFTFKNSGTVVKSQAFTVSAPPFPANPIDTASEFVRRQYLDFLNREPDGPGSDFWTDNITKCSDPARRPASQTEAECTSRQRETTSAAFFISPEFQNTGYFVLRVYRGSLNRMPFFGGSVPADPNKDEFTRDHATVSAGIVVNNQLDAGVINANKQAFVNAFVNRAEFRAIYDGLNNQQYVDKLIQTTGVPTTPELQQERQQLIDRLNAPTPTETRASVLFKIVDGTQTGPDGGLTFQTRYGQAFYDQQFKPAFVQMEYFGYMKRDPDDAGYLFWLGKLNSFPSFVEAQMVLAFISSPEYRARFGQP